MPMWTGQLTIQNDIPVFCPALTDGSLGDMIYFHTYKTETQLSIDIVSDIRRLNDMSVKAKQAGMIILGGGVCKHQIANAMLFVSLNIVSYANAMLKALVKLPCASQVGRAALILSEERGRLCGIHQYRSRGMSILAFFGLSDPIRGGTNEAYIWGRWNQV